jgi:hypothetical protein
MLAGAEGVVVHDAADGTAQPLPAVLAGKKVVVLFRHCLWHRFGVVLRAFLDDARLRAALEASGYELVGIGQGELKALRSWGRLNKWPGALYSDTDQPRLPAFAALGATFRPEPAPCAKTCARALVGTWFALSMILCRGCPPNLDLVSGFARNNVLVQSGVFVFNAAGELVLQEAMRDTDTPLPAAAVAEALT